MNSRQNYISSLPFLINHGQANWWGHPSLSQHFCEFNQEAYQDHLFDMFKVRCPETVKKSVVKRRSEFLAGRYCAQKALEELELDSPIIRIGQHREPIWPQGIMGAISHTTGLATAIVSNDPNVTGLGIDVELTVEPDTMDKIGKHIMPLENLDILHTKALLPQEVFTLIFSVKESFYKAAYPRVQRFFDFKAVNVVEFDVNERRITFKIAEKLCDTLQVGREVNGYYHRFSDDTWATLVCLD
ncbi:4'-phosphopantetheinyl transferase family protein [Alteromonas sp. a30]|uniref:4'-phosphopantetheinyl transferase family protein n=1 Tax=Alteromonas sp. a30 TaxID=2730917 RepID=UPI0022802958|nr:4'-phosphopantetheinyl transferase superfamily protein [Alteromonas sp. a30]MCY7295380.1 4'-phosphopantetheinyl transferase superfamily protein [Alteromonas sp. a30]